MNHWTSQSQQQNQQYYQQPQTTYRNEEPITPRNWYPPPMAPPPQSPPPRLAPYPEFEFGYDSQMQGYYPPPPPTPQSSHPNQLFSHSETSNLMGFLDNFNRDIDPALAREAGHPRQQQQHSHSHLPSNGSHASSEYPTLPPIPDNIPAHGLTQQKNSGYMDMSGDFYYSAESGASTNNSQPVRSTRPPAQRRHSSASVSTASPINATSKASLSTPQKRINHIMSEQKRRNAIREGYSTLIQLLAPENGGPMIEMPTRGRPKGSGAKNRGQTRGKSGILFRAVEFTKWLEDGNEALRKEVERMEEAARGQRLP